MHRQLGPLDPEIAEAVEANDLVVTSALSGNRNFEGRVNPLTRANYLASPPLVVAYALAGTMDIDFESEPIGQDADGKDVFLRDIWPTHQEVTRRSGARSRRSSSSSATRSCSMASAVARRELRAGDRYRLGPGVDLRSPAAVLRGRRSWRSGSPKDIEGARVLCLLGDSVTTDHISPAGAIALDGPAAKYLQEHGVSPARLQQLRQPPRQPRGHDARHVRQHPPSQPLGARHRGWHHPHLPSSEQMSIFDASMKYQADGTPLIVIAGKEYGTGSSRDWAAKGT